MKRIILLLLLWSAPADAVMTLKWTAVPGAASYSAWVPVVGKPCNMSLVPLGNVTTYDFPDPVGDSVYSVDAHDASGKIIKRLIWIRTCPTCFTIEVQP